MTPMPHGPARRASGAAAKALLRAVLALALLTGHGAGAAAHARTIADPGWHRVAGQLATVVYEDPALTPWAREVAVRADLAVRLAARLWDVPPPPVTVVVDDLDDRFNAWADPVVGPTIALRTRRAVPGEVGAAAPDPLLVLLVHEAVHAVHLGARPPSLPAGTGIAGAHVPWPPPSWLLEGIAVWAESRLLAGGGGRLDDAEVRGVLRVLADEGPWPSLADASLITHGAWPAGEVRYLVGGAFVDRLVRRHGLPAIREALRRFETAPPWTGFDQAWRDTTGTALEEEWRGLRRALRTEARARGGSAPAALATGRDPVRSPDGSRLAWLQDDAVHVTSWSTFLAGRADEQAASHRLSGPASDPVWWGDDRLAFARVRATPDDRYRELWALDLATGEERLLSEGARGYAPAPLADGCLAFVRDTASEGSSLRRLCEGGPRRGEPWWAPPEGERIVAVASSSRGRLAAVLVGDGASRLVELTPSAGTAAAGTGVAAAGVAASGSLEVRELSAPAGELRDPVWEAGGTLLVRSDAGGGAFESWRVNPGGDPPVRLTHTTGGVVGHAEGVVALGRAGPAGLAPMPEPGSPGAAPRPRQDGSDAAPAVRGGGREAGGAPPGGAAGSAPRSPPVAPAWTEPGDEGEVRSYVPVHELRPIGWTPAVSGPDLGVRLHWSEPTGGAGASLTVGASLDARGPLGAVFAYGEVTAGDAAFLPVPRRPDPLRVRVRAGVAPHRPHRTGDAWLVPRLDVSVQPLLAADPTVRLGVEAGVVVLPEDGPRAGGALRLAASDGRVDAWAVPVRGWIVAASAVADPLPGGRHAWGTWLDGAGWWSLGSAAPRWTATLRAGANPPPPVAAGPWGGLAGSASLAAEWTLPVRLRVADGRWAFERLRIAPGARLQAAAGDGGGLAAGLEAAVSADLVLNYGAPATVRAAAGVMWGDHAAPWARLALPLPY